MSSPLWTPSPDRVAAANMTAFKDRVAAEHGVDLPDYAALYDWSIANMEAFWTAIWDECGVIAETRGDIQAAKEMRVFLKRFKSR